MAKKPKRPTDVNERAKLIVDILTKQTTEENSYKDKNPAAVALGRLGGLKGGKARAKKLTASKRKEIAKKAAKARWKNK
jgi:hypothetical protein